jgi:hypothetical protein
LKSFLDVDLVCGSNRDEHKQKGHSLWRQEMVYPVPLHNSEAALEVLGETRHQDEKNINFLCVSLMFLFSSSLWNLSLDNWVSMKISIFSFNR